MLLAQAHQHHPQQIGKMLTTILNIYIYIYIFALGSFDVKNKKILKNVKARYYQNVKGAKASLEILRLS